MRILKKFLIGLVITLVLLIVFAIFAPMIFKDQIIAGVKSSINENLAAELDFSDASVSFLSSFPDVNLTVEEFSLVGIDTFAGLPLTTGQSASVDINFWSIWDAEGVYEIESVELDQPLINLLVLDNNLANYNITLASETPAEVPEETSSAGGMLFRLKSYEINQGHFIYDNRATDTYLEIQGLDHQGQGDFTTDVFDLDTRSEAKTVTLRQSGVAYLNQVKTTIDALINVDLTNSVYSFKDNQIRLNELELQADGSIAMEEEDILFNLEVNAPANDFRQLWSLIPTAYTAGYEDIAASGSFTLNASVDGPYNAERPAYPAIRLSLGVDGGAVQYPGQSIGINGIFADVNLNSPSSDLNQLVLDISRFSMNLGNDPFSGSFRLATPISDPLVDARLDGQIDLSKWSQAVPLEGIEELSGIIDADLTMNNVRQSSLTAGRYDGLDMSGNMSVENLVYASTEMPRIEVASASADFSPQQVSVPAFDAQLGRSDLSGSGTISNVLAYFSPEQTMRGDVQLRSRLVDIDEWMPADASTSAELSPAQYEQQTQAAETEVFDRFDFRIDAQVDELRYAEYIARNNQVNGSIQPNSLTLNSFGSQVGSTRVNGSGQVNNLLDYGLGKGVLSGELTMTSPRFEVADFMAEETITPDAAGPAASSTGEENAIVAIPANIDLRMNIVADQVQYTNIELNDFRGSVVIQDEAVVVEDGSSRLLGGRANFAGAYDTSDPEEPGFRFHYDLQTLDFGQAFSTLNSFAALAPIGRFIQGNFSSDLILEGTLGKDFYPVLSSIDAKGFLATANAQLAQIGPLQKIGQALDVQALASDVNLSSLQTWFEITDGKVEVKPFDVTVAGIPMNIQGSHGIDAAMDYQILAAIPREMIEGNIVTGSALAALDGIAGQASRLGFNLEQGDTLNLLINLGGSMANPSTSFNLVGRNEGNSSLATALAEQAQEQVTEAVQEQVNEVRNQVEEQVNAQVDQTRAQIDSARAAVTQQANTVIDSARTVAAQGIDSLRNAALQQVGGALVGRDSTRQDSSGNVLDQATEEIRGEIERFNPFRRRNRNQNNDDKKEGG